MAEVETLESVLSGVILDEAELKFVLDTLAAEGITELTLAKMIAVPEFLRVGFSMETTNKIFNGLERHGFGPTSSVSELLDICIKKLNRTEEWKELKLQVEENFKEVGIIESWQLQTLSRTDMYTLDIPLGLILQINVELQKFAPKFLFGDESLRKEGIEEIIPLNNNNGSKPENDYYDVSITFVCATGLKRKLLNNNYYLKARVGAMHFSTKPSATTQPRWEQQWPIHNVPQTSCLHIEVWNRSFGGMADTLVGESKMYLSFEELKVQPNVDSNITLEVSSGGTITLRIWMVQSHHKVAVPFGSNKYKMHTSTIAGLMTGTLQSTLLPGYSCYEIMIHNVREFFGDSKQPWNRNYAAAQAIFGDSTASYAIRQGIRTQHSSLYRKGIFRTSSGMLYNGDDFLRLIDYGIRSGRSRMFTYVLLEDRLRFSETSSFISRDFMSKHATHANAIPEVVYSGEFMIYMGTKQELEKVRREEKKDGLILEVWRRKSSAALETQSSSTENKQSSGDMLTVTTRKLRINSEPKPMERKESQDGKDLSRPSSSVVEAETCFWLVIDNNSGTYSPDPSMLPKLKDLLEANFSGLFVEALAYNNPKLIYYTALVRQDRPI